MYKKIIKSALNYTRPLLIGRLYYEDKYVANDISSMIVINKNGDILTTARNADIFIQTAEYNEIYPPILKEIEEAKPKNRIKLEKKYGINKDTIVGLNNIIIDIANNPGKLKIVKHAYLDLAIFSIENNTDLLVDEFPIFAKNKIDAGDSICSVGFALPEYKAFTYDKDNYNLKSTYEFMNFPVFPSEGIMCRNIADKENIVSMFEMSNTVFTGQEGGPILDKNNHLVGMIAGFRVINDAGVLSKIGIAINKDEIIKFLNENNIEYEVEKWKRS